MAKLYAFLVFVIIINGAMGLNRPRRQSDSQDENNLEDRYGGWDRPIRPQGRPRPSQNGGRQIRPFPNQPWDNRPGQQWGGQTGDQQWGGGGSRPNQPWENQNQQNQGWDNQGQQNQGWDNQNQGQQNQPGQQTTLSPGGSTSQSPEVAACILRCPSTPEYNPVCGSNSVTYSNPGKLTCAQTCGVNVNLQRSSPCPTTTTAAPPS